MKDFFKYVLATIVGLILSQIILSLLFMIFIGIIIASASFGDKSDEADIKSNSILHLKLDFPIVERTSDDPFQQLAFILGDREKPLSLKDITDNIRQAADDDRIKGIYLDLSFFSGRNATLEEVRNALLDFKKSGKFIYAYSDVLSQKTYLLSSMADSIFMQPEGMVAFTGFASELAFFKGTLEKLNIEARVIKVGKFKSAVEPFIREDMSDENREQMKALVESMYTHYLQNVSDSRGLSVAELRRIADSALVVNPQQALQYRMIDGLAYRDQVTEKLKARLDVEEDKDLNLLTLKEFNKKDKKESAKDKIALIYAVGEIGMGEGDEQSIGSESLSKAIRKARKDDDIKAIVLRVNSPGGSALASDVIWREMVLAKEAKPVIVSMGDVAASGGYYIACAADTIVAEPNTVTGSIGVFALLPGLEKFWEDKLGITFDRYCTGPYADLGNPNRELRPEERQIIQHLVNNIYADFITKVGEGRGLDTAFVDSIGQGRVWTGLQARDRGLVDVMGGLDSALAIAARSAGLDKYQIRILPERKNPFEKIISDLSGQARTYILKSSLQEDYELYRQVQALKERKGIQALMPYNLDIQ
ncbi:MAG: signal peptide peptidase SppA [Bacteroidia bacterium]